MKYQFLGDILVKYSKEDSKLSKKEFGEYKKKHMAYHREEEKKDKKEDKKMIKAAMKKKN